MVESENYYRYFISLQSTKFSVTLGRSDKVEPLLLWEKRVFVGRLERARRKQAQRLSGKPPECMKVSTLKIKNYQAVTRCPPPFPDRVL